MWIKKILKITLVIRAVAVLTATNCGYVGLAATCASPSPKHNPHGSGSPPCSGSSHYRFLTLSITGAASPVAYGINDAGLVSGFYSDSNLGLALRAAVRAPKAA